MVYCGKLPPFTLSFILQIPTTTVRILLNHFKWDKEKLYEKYYTESRPEKIFEDAQLLSPDKMKEIAAKVKSASLSRAQPVAVFDCDICLLSLPKSVCKTHAKPPSSSRNCASISYFHSFPVHDRVGVRAPVLHDLLDGVPHCEDNGRRGIPEHSVSDRRLSDARR